MNLIEQLGGYKKSLDLFRGCPWDDGTVDVPNPFSKGMLRLDLGELRSELLEYRRQHNIFEIGDLITHPAYDWKILKVHDPIPGENTLFAFTNDHVKHHWGHGIVFEKNGVVMVTYNDCRHATDAEIKAGKRL